MEQSLIDQLWRHTDRMDRMNALRFTREDFQRRLDQLKPNEPILMPAVMFLEGKFQDLFMSFHHEGSNSLLHYHDFFELIYTCKGSPVGVFNGQEIVLETGSLCVMNPNAAHYFKQYSEKSDLVLNIVLAKAVFQKSLLRILFSDPVLNAFFIRYQLENESRSSFLFMPHLNKEVEHLIENLLREYLDQRQYSQVIIESLLTLIFAQIVRTFGEADPKGNPVLSEILNDIYLNYQQIRLEELASKYNYHPKYLSALIHRETGQTFRSLLTTIRLQNAVNHLLYSDMSVEAIAQAIGYGERSSFYSAFRKAYQTSPAQYRLLHRASGE